MQVQRGVVLRLDPGDHHMFIQPPRFGDQRNQQFAAQAFPLMVGVNVHRMLHGVAKAVKRAPVAKRGIAGDDAVFLAHQHRKAGQLAGFKPRDAVVGIHGFVIPDSGGMHDGVVIDLGDRRAIVFNGRADGHSKPQFFVHYSSTILLQ